jgi:hypothetical protein
MAMSVRSKIAEQFQQVAKEQDRELLPLSDEVKLVQKRWSSPSRSAIS